MICPSCGTKIETFESAKLEKEVKDLRIIVQSQREQMAAFHKERIRKENARYEMPE